MLPADHPHAWDANTAGQHLSAATRRQFPAGGQLVVTPQMRLLANCLPHALNRGAAIAVSGPYGSGKTMTLEAVAAVADINTAIVKLPSKATEAAQWKTINEALTGVEPRGTARALQNQAREFLTAVPTLLIVDEAQFLSRSALLQLRWLWDHPFPRFAIILAGSDLHEHLADEPSVDTRIDRRITLHHHGQARMLTLIRAHHPVAAATEPAVLQFICDAYAAGSWRSWSKVLHAATELGNPPALTIEVAQDAIEVVTGIRPAHTVPLAGHPPRRAQPAGV